MLVARALPLVADVAVLLVTGDRGAAFGASPRKEVEHVWERGSELHGYAMDFRAPALRIRER